MIKIYYSNKKFSNHIEYAFESLFRCVGINNYSFSFDYSGEEKIVYGHEEPKGFTGVFIGEGRLFSEIYLTKKCIPEVPLIRNINGTPILFNADVENDVGDKSALKRNDIIQGTFFLLAGMEELINTEKNYYDKYGRYDPHNRILYREHYFDRPIINEYAQLLATELGIKNSNKPVAVISHDLDLPFKEYNLIGKILNKLNIPFTKEEDPYIDYILQFENRLGIISSWYIMTSNHSNEYDGKYNCYDKIIKKLIEKLKISNREVGLHYGFDTSESEEKFIEQSTHFFRIVGEKRLFGRNHYLRYKLPNSFDIYNRNNVYYDSTLGSAQEEGFIFGICTPFKLFNARQGQKLEVWELPLIIMEATLFQKAYKGYSHKNAYNKVESLLEQVVKHNGCLTFLWHSSSFEREHCYKNIRETYEKLMLLISERMECVSGMQAIEHFDATQNESDQLNDMNTG